MTAKHTPGCSETVITQFGFDFGPATVTRHCSHPRHGVWLSVSGKRQIVEIRVTRSGLLRVGHVERNREGRP